MLQREAEFNVQCIPVCFHGGRETTSTFSSHLSRISSVMTSYSVITRMIFCF